MRTDIDRCCEPSAENADALAAFGRNLRTLRRLRGLTRAELARRSGVTPYVVFELEVGAVDAAMTLSTGWRIAS